MGRPPGAQLEKQRVRITRGDRFGSLTIIGEAPAIHVKKWRVRMAECRCDCGRLTITRIGYLRSGHTTSCGCKKKEASHWSHRQSGTRLYAIWAGMKTRCLNPNSSSYEHYGARGISLCSDWLEFESFHEWAIANGYKRNLTIERVDVDGDYSPENCTWIPRAQQSANRRPTMKNSRLIAFQGRTKTLTQWAAKVGLHPGTLSGRLANGWPVERALTTPVRSRRV